MESTLVVPRPLVGNGTKPGRIRRLWTRLALATATFGAYSSFAAPAFAWPGCSC